MSGHDEQRQPLMDDGGVGGIDDRDRGPSRRHASAAAGASVAEQVGLANGRRKPLKAGEKMWVIATTSLITFLAFSSQLFVLIPYWLDTPGVTFSEMALCLIPFNVGIAAIFYNYYLVVFTNPGSVPEGWEPEWDAIAGVEVKASTGQPRYCKVCRSYKPPRAHHCRTCKRCVLRMDHHCPWVANCVGHGNYGHFLRFLYSVDVTMAIHLTLLCLRVADWWSPMVLWREPSTFDMVMMILNFAQGVPVFLMVSIFSLYHTYALCTNTTTIESWEKDKVATLIRRGKIEEIKFPYDLGMKRNIQSVLGRRMLFWCWPGATPMGNGMDYSPGEGHDWRDQFYWPPRDPTRPGGRRVRRRGDGGSKAGEADDKANARFRLPASGPFTYGGEGFNPALVPSNAAARSTTNGPDDAASLQPSLRRRNSPGGGPAGLYADEDETNGADTLGWSSHSPYHPRRAGRDGDDDDDAGVSRPRRSASPASSVSSAEEAGVVDAGCSIPAAGRWRRSKTGDSGGKDQNRSAASDSDSAEEHELLAAREARRWGQGEPSRSHQQRRETFPRLWAEEDSASEDSDVGSEGDADDDDDKPIASLGQLRSRVRRGSEGYEVRPMMYDRAYAAQMVDEEERLRAFLMQERERLGTQGAEEYEAMYGGGSLAAERYGAEGLYRPPVDYDGDGDGDGDDAWGQGDEQQR